MSKLGFTCWQNEDFWIGYLDEYPDHMTQGETLEELKENLSDLYKDISGGEIPFIRKHAELEVA